MASKFIRSKRFSLDSRTSYLLAPDPLINNGMELVVNGIRRNIYTQRISNISYVAAFKQLTGVNTIDHVTKSCVRIIITYIEWP